MQQLIAMIAGMAVLGTIIYRIWSFNLRRFMIALSISLFIYGSVAIGLLLLDSEGVVNFMMTLSEIYIIDITAETYENVVAIALLVFWIISLFVGMNELGIYNPIYILTRFRYHMAVSFGAILYTAVFVVWLAISYLLFNTNIGLSIVFILMLAFIATINSLLGIIAVGVNGAFVLIQVAKGESLNLFSFIGMIDIVQIDEFFISIVVLLITSIVGGTESVMNALSGD